MSPLAPVFRALNAAGARYVVVGGVAVVLHGFARFTADLDLVIDLSPAEVSRTVTALDALGLRPRAPVPLLALADPEQRRAWVEEKGMTVLSLWDPAEPLREVDVFVAPPIAFDDLIRRAVLVALPDGAVPVAGIDDLIAMKRLADRPEDRLDIEALTALREERDRG